MNVWYEQYMQEEQAICEECGKTGSTDCNDCATHNYIRDLEDILKNEEEIQQKEGKNNGTK